MSRLLRRDVQLNGFRGIGLRNNIEKEENLVYSESIVYRNGRYYFTDGEEINNLTLGELIDNCIYEGDILVHSDYPGRLFEFQYYDGSWSPVVLYGTNGDMELGRFPQSTKEYTKVGWKFSYSWYPVNNFPPIREGYIFLGWVDNVKSVYYNSQFGDIGDVLVEYGPLDFVNYNILKVIEMYPEIKNLLKNRKLISEKCGCMF